MSEYKAAQQLAKLNCFSCGKSVLVDAEDQESVQQSASWIMIVPSSGEKLATCSKACAKNVVVNLPGGSNLVVVE